MCQCVCVCVFLCYFFVGWENNPETMYVVLKHKQLGSRFLLRAERGSSCSCVNKRAFTFALAHVSAEFTGGEAAE